MTDYQALRRSGPTPEQHVQFAELQEEARRKLEDIVSVHSCNRLSGGDRVVEIVVLGKQLVDGGSTDALASLLAVAIDMLAEKSWGAQR
jgi:hypothetical protein